MQLRLQLRSLSVVSLFYGRNAVRIKIMSQEVEDLTFKQATLIGLIQCLALIPGTSRSGSTIIGSLFLGISRKAAAEFSFFLGIPVLMGGRFMDMYKMRHELHE